eukprot:gene531-1009_t
MTTTSKPLVLYFDIPQHDDECIEVIGRIMEHLKVTPNSYGLQFFSIKYVDIKNERSRSPGKKLAKSVSSVMKQTGTLKRLKGNAEVAARADGDTALDTDDVMLQETSALQCVSRFEALLHRVDQGDPLQSHPASRANTRPSSPDMRYEELELMSHGKVVILTDFPATKFELNDLVNSIGNKYPLLDGIIRFVKQGHGSTESSINGPYTTAFEKRPFTHKMHKNHFHKKKKLDHEHSNFEIVSTFKDERDTYGKNWNDITLDEIDIMEINDITGEISLKNIDVICDEFSKMAQTLSSQKSSFHKYCSRSTMIDVHYNEKSHDSILQAIEEASNNIFHQKWSTDELYSNYMKCVDEYIPPLQGTGALLLSMTKAISITNNDEENYNKYKYHNSNIASSTNTNSSGNNNNNNNNINNNKASLLSVQKPSRHLSFISSTSANSTSIPPQQKEKDKDEGHVSVSASAARQYDTTTTINQNQNPKVALAIAEGDLQAFRSHYYRIMSSTSTTSAAIDIEMLNNLINFEYDAIQQAQSAGLLGQGGLPLRPIMTISERGIQETEILTFSSLSASDVHRYHQMEIFKEMLDRIQEPLMNFTGALRATDGVEWSLLKRRYFRNISPLSLQQHIVNDRVKEPVIIRHYYPLVDELLVAMFWPPPSRRMKTHTWNVRDNMRSRPSFKQFLVATESKNAVNTFININDKDLKKYNRETITVTPADKSLVKLNYLPASHVCWLSVYVGDNMIGLRIFNTSTSTSTPTSNSSLSPSTRPKTGADHSSHERRKSSVASQHSETEAVPLGCFVWNTKDDVRISVAVKSVADETSLKPDRKSTVYTTLTSPKGMTVTACSDGVIRILTPIQYRSSSTSTSTSIPSATATSTSNNNAMKAQTPESTLLSELSRVVIGSCVSRNINITLFPTGPFSRELLYGDGTRILMRNPSYNSEDNNCSNTNNTNNNNNNTGLESSKIHPRSVTGNTITSTTTACGKSPKAAQDTPLPAPKKVTKGFLATLIEDAPKTWKYFRFDVMGRVVCCFSDNVQNTNNNTTTTTTNNNTHTHTHANSTNNNTHTNNGNTNNTHNTSNTHTHTNTNNTHTGGNNTHTNSNNNTHTGNTNNAHNGGTNTHTHSSNTNLTPNTSNSNSNSQVMMSKTMFHDIRSVSIDASTRAEITEYKDGRIIITYPDKLKKVYYPDGTLFSSATANHQLLLIEKLGYPGIEIDLEIDDISTRHAQGLQIPISKGGERIRSRIVTSDGSTIIIKYDTRITSTSNGSIKLVRRDRYSLLTKDGGDVRFYPQSMWGPKEEEIFSAECANETSTSTSITTKNNKSTPKASKYNSLSITDATKDNNNNSLSVSLLGTETSQSIVKRGNQKTDQGVKSGNRSRDMIRDITTGAVAGAGGTGRVTVSRSEQISTVLQHELLPTAAVESVYTFSDNEHNSFKFDLSKPTEVLLDLAGEVEGVKAKAVSQNPIEPKLYVVGRNLNAVEVVRIQDVADMERAVVLCDDIYKSENSAQWHPADLGGGSQITYTTRRRIGDIDGYTFCDVYPARNWHERTVNTALTIALNRTQSNNPSLLWLLNNVPPSPMVYQMMAMTETMALSDEGYSNLENAIHKWMVWRDQRSLAVNRFAVDDPRPEEDIALEAEIRKRLKKAYKRAKDAASKRRKSLNLYVRTEDASVGPEGQAAQDDYPNFSDSDPEDEEPEDPEDIEIGAAFDTFKVTYPDGNERVPLEDLRAALVQVYNQHVDPRHLNIILSDDMLSNLDSFTLEDLRTVYFRLRSYMIGNDDEYEETKPVPKFRENSYINNNGQGGGGVGVVASSTSVEKRYGNNQEDEDGDDMQALIAQTRSFFSTRVGQAAAAEIPEMNPPLHQQPLDWTNRRKILASEEYNLAAGSGIKAARRKN